MKKPDAITLWCRPCSTGYASTGERPDLCPKCNQVPHWTLTPPYVLSGNDKRFLQSLRIQPDAAPPFRFEDQDDGA